MKEISTHAVTRMILEDIMLAEVSQTQDGKYYDSTYMRQPYLCSIETENYNRGWKGAGGYYIISRVQSGLM